MFIYLSKAIIYTNVEVIQNGQHSNGIIIISNKPYAKGTELDNMREHDIST